MYEGRLVGLREFSEQDLLPSYQWVNDERLNKFLTFAIYPRTLEQAKDFLNAQLRRRDDTYVNFAIYRLADAARQYIGSIGFKNIDLLQGHAELHVGLCSVDHLGKGYGTDAVQLLLRFGFDRLNLHKVWLQVIAFNIGGIKAYQNSGFKIDGTLRQHFHYSNERHDMLILSILRDEYYDRIGQKTEKP